MTSMSKRLLRSHALRFGLAWALFLLSALALGPARAQDTDWPNEYGEGAPATLFKGLFGRGGSMPLDIGNTEEGQAKNRRAHVGCESEATD